MNHTVHKVHNAMEIVLSLIHHLAHVDPPMTRDEKIEFYHDLMAHLQDELNHVLEHVI